MRKILPLIAGIIIGAITGWFACKRSSPSTDARVTETVESRVDTAHITLPVPESEMQTGTAIYTVPANKVTGGGTGAIPRQYPAAATSTTVPDTISTSLYDPGTDSLQVELPVIRRHYRDSTYEAWVSGPVDPRLDSLRVFAPTTVVTRREVKPPDRWHLGISAGYAVTPKGMQPYIGIALTYSLISF